MDLKPRLLRQSLSEKLPRRQIPLRGADSLVIKSGQLLDRTFVTAKRTDVMDNGAPLSAQFRHLLNGTTWIP